MIVYHNPVGGAAGLTSVLACRHGEGRTVAMAFGGDLRRAHAKTEAAPFRPPLTGGLREPVESAARAVREVVLL